MASFEGHSLVVFNSVHLKSCLIRGLAFGGRDLIRRLAFGGRDLIRGLAFGGRDLIRGLAFGGRDLIRGDYCIEFYRILAKVKITTWQQILLLKNYF